MIKVKSPITGKENTKLLKTIDAAEIVSRYNEYYSIDVKRFFEGKKEIQVFECEETGYKFFYPLDISGDGVFYENLQQYDWYYMPWKWEHQQTAKLIKPGMKVLEVGCAEGDFIEKIQKEFGGICSGVELNEHAAAGARLKGLDVKIQSIQDFSVENEGVYDLVCSFQVLEHISEIYSFIEAMLKCLKKGGKLIIGVPNNDSFLGLSDNLLNIPPHHMGLWNKKSLSSLADIFNMQLEKFYFEPLQDYHEEYYKKTIHDCAIQKMDENISKYGFLGRVLNQLEKRLFEKKLRQKFPNVDSFTVLVEFSKK